MKISRKGFTLIELLVVIAIISILTAIVVSNLTQSKAKSRDAKRISDIAQIQLALELFFDRCGQYPTSPLDTTYFCLSPSIPFSTFISQIPKDPNTNSYEYSLNSGKTDYILKATLETNNVATVDRYIGSVSGFSPAITCAGTNDYCVVPR